MWGTTWGNGAFGSPIYAAPARAPSLYDRFYATALRLLAKFGQLWTLTTTIAEGVTTTRTAFAARLGTPKHNLIDSGVSIGDAYFIFDGDAEPLCGDVITCAGGSFAVVVEPEPIKPGDRVVAWYVWGRKH